MKLSIGTNTLKFICDKIATKKNATQKNLENENKIWRFEGKSSTWMEEIQKGWRAKARTTQEFFWRSLFGQDDKEERSTFSSIIPGLKKNSNRKTFKHRLELLTHSRKSKHTRTDYSEAIYRKKYFLITIFQEEVPNCKKNEKKKTIYPRNKKNRSIWNMFWMQQLLNSLMRRI